MHNVQYSLLFDLLLSSKQNISMEHVFRKKKKCINIYLETSYKKDEFPTDNIKFLGCKQSGIRIIKELERVKLLDSINCVLKN